MTHGKLQLFTSLMRGQHRKQPHRGGGRGWKQRPGAEGLQQSKAQMALSCTITVSANDE